MRPVSTASEEGRLKLLLSESGGGELWGGPEENSASEGGSKLQRRGLEDALSMKPIPAQAHGRWHLILQPGMAGTRNSPKSQGFRAIILRTCLFPAGRQNTNLYGLNWLLVWFSCMAEPRSSFFSSSPHWAVRKLINVCRFPALSSYRNDSETNWNVKFFTAFW